jgi:hypothetical protein
MNWGVRLLPASSGTGGRMRGDEQADKRAKKTGARRGIEMDIGLYDLQLTEAEKHTSILEHKDPDSASCELYFRIMVHVMCGLNGGLPK